MASAAVRPAPSGAFTFDDLDNAPDDGRRWELIAGSLVVNPAPTGRHQRLLQRLARVLEDAETAGTIVVQSPYDWRATQTTEGFQPDLVVARRTDYDPDGPLSATPLLCAEVLSSSNPGLDRVVKRQRYEALGVPAYWIVDPVGPSITELRLRAGRYDEAQVAAGDERLVTDWPFPVAVRLPAVARPD
jgi:Uma2 family endonuclease